MVLTEEIQTLIIKENTEFRVRQYGGLTKEELEKFGVIYTGFKQVKTLRVSTKVRNSKKLCLSKDLPKSKIYGFSIRENEKLHVII